MAPRKAAFRGAKGDDSRKRLGQLSFFFGTPVICRTAAAAAWLIRDVGIDRGQTLELLSLKVAASPGSRPITRAELEAVLSWVK